jgi:hypothetical protein
MRRLGLITGTILPIVAGVFGLRLTASENGEVVVVTTFGSSDDSFSTRLWVVDYDNAAWIRAGSSKPGWYQSIAENPRIEVRRGAVAFSALSDPRPDLRPVINGAMREKYGWADNVIEFLFGRETAIPIQLITQTDQD